MQKKYLVIQSLVFARDVKKEDTGLRNVNSNLTRMVVNLQTPKGQSPAQASRIKLTQTIKNEPDAKAVSSHSDLVQRN